MLFDANVTFSQDQSLAQVAGTYLSDKSVDTLTVGTPVIGGPLIKDWGRGAYQLEVVSQVTTTFVGATATLTVNLVMADDGPLSVNLTTLYSSPAIAVTALTAGKQIPVCSIPPGITRRFLGLSYVIATATTTAGKVWSGITKGRQTNINAV